MWEKTEAQKPKGERKPLPKKPVVDNRALGGGDGGKMTQKDMDAYNEEAFKNYNDNVLDKCERCGRTFLPERLPIHMKGCKGPTVKKTPNMNSSNKLMGSVGSPSIKGSTSKCSNCGKEYAAKLLDYHMKRCKQGGPRDHLA